MKIKCLKCNDIIESLSQHDFKYCKCNACSIDGGTQMQSFAFVLDYKVKRNAK